MKLKFMVKQLSGTQMEGRVFKPILLECKAISEGVLGILQEKGNLFFSFLGQHPCYMEVPRVGVESELPTPQPQPQPHQIRVASVTLPHLMERPDP